MSRWSPVYVPEIETGRHVKNNACAVKIKIKWMIRKHMTHTVTIISSSLNRLLLWPYRYENLILIILRSLRNQ